MPHMICKNKTNNSRLLARFRNMWYIFEFENEYNFPNAINCWNIVQQMYITYHLIYWGWV